MSISIESIDDDPAEKQQVEIVERKGLGHPDSICDGLAEKISRELCREYRERFGKILHHNTDEAQLVAGSSNPEIAGGEIVEPIYILLTGRATKEFQGEDIPVDKIAVDAAREYIDNNFKQLSSDDIEFESRIGETSSDLEAIFSEEVPVSNDTSFGVAHAPFSPLEKTVRNLEPRLRTELNEVGEDIKIMGVRSDDEIHLTVAAAGIGSRLDSEEEYEKMTRKVEKKAREVASRFTDLDVQVDVNTADTDEERYVTVTGTSAEMGDDGSVGRGNRVNGLITPNRAMSMEAASGKNPVTHVGKIYNLLSQEIAQDIHSETGEFAQVKIVSQIGKPIDEPKKVSVETTSEEDDSIEKIVEDNLDSIKDITEKVVEGRLKTF